DAAAGFLRGSILPYATAGGKLFIESASVVVMALYLARQPQLYRDGVLSLLPPKYRPLGGRVLDDTGATLRAWVVAQLLAMMILAALTALGLWVLDVPYWLAFGIFAGLVAVVPFFGPLVSTLLPALFVIEPADFCVGYVPERVVAVFDRGAAGRTVQDVLGFGGSIPVVGDFARGLALGASAVLIGIAPMGGQLPPEWRGWLKTALERGLEIWSGLHTFIGDDPELGSLARAQGVRILDVRKPPPELPIADGRAAEVDPYVILTVGSDCNVGKMTAQLELRDELVRRGVRARFVATGQTGIFIEGWGIAVDAVVADFVAGAAEQLVLQGAVDADVVLVEGQGSLIHPGYSGVTLGLL